MKKKTISRVIAAEAIDSCLVCYNTPCTRACPQGLDPARIIRSLRFKNTWGAAEQMPDEDVCLSCDTKNCMDACLKGKISNPVEIDKLMAYSSQLENSQSKKELRINFLGFECENPFILSSSVVASNYEMVAKAFEMGWGGVAFKTIGTFIPEEVSPRFTTDGDYGKAFRGFKNIEQISDHSLEDNIGFLKKLKKNYPSKLIIVSILGTDEEEWTYLAKIMTEAGVDMIECNFSCPHMAGDGLGSDVGQDPVLVAKYTAATRRGTHLPIIAKMTPNIGNMEIPAIAAVENGADGIAAINTIKSIMNVNLDDFSSEPNIEGKSAIGGYSGNAVKPIALRFIHDMKKHDKLANVPISGMGGIETWKDAAEFIALGCTNLQVTTSVMQYGYRVIEDLIDGLSTYLGKMGFENLDAFVGNALEHILPADRLNRQSIVYPKFDRQKCIRCGRCYISCYDGGHQAIAMDDKGNPTLIPDKCVGCHLCKVVCPAEAIGAGKRMEVIL
jgi:dihydropyrimidine dehydrogenase (NAD+) subunit PreA